MGILGKIVSYGYRAIKATPKLFFGTNSEIAGKAARTAYKGASGSIFSKVGSAVKAGGKAIEKGGTGSAFWKGVCSSIKSLPKFLYKATKVGAKGAKAAGKSGFWGGLKGFFGGIGKKMPLIGSLIAVGFEIPNIWAAGKGQGAGEALKETGKAAARLAGGAAGAAIGSAICPGIGTLIGWVAGEWLTGKIVGKTYTEKKDELIEQYKLTEEQISQAQEQGYTVDQLLEEMESNNSAASAAGDAAEDGNASSNNPASDAPTPSNPVASGDSENAESVSNPGASGDSENAESVSNPGASGDSENAESVSNPGASAAAEDAQPGTNPEENGATENTGSGTNTEMPTTPVANTGSQAAVPGMFNPGIYSPGMFNPGLSMGMTNPFAQNFGIGGGCFNDFSNMYNPFLQPGENIFEKYPLGYKFTYI